MTKKKTVYIRFFVKVEARSVQVLLNVIDQKLRKGVNKFVLLISSSGGKASAGVTGYSYLKGIPAEVITHNFGRVKSAAVLLFCAGKKRLSVPHAAFLIHPPHSTFSKGAMLDEKKLEEHLKLGRIATKNTVGIIAETTGKNEEEVMANLRNSTTLTSKEAVKYGLVHEIKKALFEKGAEVLNISFTKAKIISVKEAK